jgi:hypothetical protein
MAQILQQNCKLDNANRHLTLFKRTNQKINPPLSPAYCKESSMRSFNKVPIRNDSSFARLFQFKNIRASKVIKLNTGELYKDVLTIKTMVKLKSLEMNTYVKVKA